MSSIKLRIEEYRPQDRDIVVRFNRVITDTWYRYTVINGKIIRGEPDNVENLSNFEQWYQGGPWNNPKMFELYVKLIEQCRGKIFLVWTEDHELLGEIDCCMANNYDESGYLLWILTYPKQRRQGIGRQLVEQCRSFFKEKNIDSVVVIPEDNNAASFYRNVGFKPFKKRIQLEIATENKTVWKDLVNNKNVTPIFSNLLEKFGLFSMYPLIESTESNDYIVQTALHREKIIEILGYNIAHQSFLPTLWRFQKGDCVAIFGNVYLFRVWINQTGLKNDQFIHEIKSCVKSYQAHVEHSETFSFFILEQDLHVFQDWDYKILREEPIFLIKNDI